MKGYGDPKEFTKQNIMRWINRLHVKTSHTRYMSDEISFQNYKEYISMTINDIRDMYMVTRFTPDDMDLIWQNLDMENSKWSIARKEIFTAIAS